MLADGGAAGRTADAASAAERRRVVRLLRPAPGERGRDGDDGARSDGARRHGAARRRAQLLTVTLGKRGVVYFAAAGLRPPRRPASPRPLGARGRADADGARRRRSTSSDAGDPTGCGDVWGATYFSRLLAGDKLGRRHPRRASRRRAQRRASRRDRPRQPSPGNAQPHVTTVITVPPSLDDQSFEQVLEQVAPLPADAKMLVDARHTRWASPYGLTALLTLGADARRAARVRRSRSRRDRVVLGARRASSSTPRSSSISTASYPQRARAGESSVLLEITPISKSEDVHEVVGRIQEKAQAIITKELSIDAQGDRRLRDDAVRGVPEHHRARRAAAAGWPCRRYNWPKRLGRRVVVIAVCDAGLGFRQSLESTPGHVPERSLGRRRRRSRRR